MKTLIRSALAFVAVGSCVLCLTASRCEAQTGAPKSSDDGVMRERIATIFRETIRSGEREFGPVGHRVVSRTFAPPSTEHVDEIKCYGDAAVPILEKYLHSSNGFEVYLALRFLGLIGSDKVVEPLRKVALDDPSSSFRFSALLSLTQTPWTSARPIIERIAEKDLSPEVQQEAKRILAQHEPK